MSVFATIGVDLGLHASSMRDTLIDASFTVGVWPLAETTSLRARDITGNRHHGVYNGSGWVRGVSLGLPEGGLGATADGNQFVEIADDSAANANLNLSLANGDIDGAILLMTTHNSATPRCIASKQTTNSSGNGWKFYHVSGAVGFFLRVAGSTIFDFTRGSISDGALHLITWTYRTVAGEAWISIDGVQSGAKVTGVTTEPAVTGAPMRFFMFTDGVAGDGSGFIGTLAYGMIGREGDDTLAASLQATRAWTSVVGDTRASHGLSIGYGITGASPLDNTAATGSASFTLNNANTNSGGVQGYYSTQHANCRTNFRKGIPCRVKFTYGGSTYVKHVGRIASIAPSPGQYQQQITRVTSVDWMDVAASTRLRGLRAQTDIDYDDLVGLVIDEALRPPHAVSLGDGSETFTYALDVGNAQRETILSEFSRAATSERGFVYIKGDTAFGGVLTVEGRGDRQRETALAATFTNTMHGLVADDSRAPNIVRVTVHPRVVDGAATTVLFTMTARQPIPPGETVVIEVRYRNPADPSVQVGGVAMVTPVASTDYTMNATAEGSGMDLTAFASIAETGDELGGTTATLTVTNSHSTSVGYFTTQLRGKGIYHLSPITVPAESATDVRKNGPAEQDVDLAYGVSTEFAGDVARHVLALYRTAQVRSISFIANDSDALMTQALAREVGDRIGIVETMTGATTVIDGSDAERGYFINYVRLEVSEGGLIVCTWTLSPSMSTGPAWVLGQAGASELGTSTVLGL